MLAWPILGGLGLVAAARVRRRSSSRRSSPSGGSTSTRCSTCSTSTRCASGSGCSTTSRTPRPSGPAPRAATRTSGPAPRTAPPSSPPGSASAPVPAMLRGTVRDGGDRKERREAVAEVQERDVLEDIPVLADLAQHALVAITGVDAPSTSLARAMLLRLAFDHSPAELSSRPASAASARHHEAWLRWLPHAAARLGGEPPVAVGARAAHRAARPPRRRGRRLRAHHLRRRRGRRHPAPHRRGRRPGRRRARPAPGLAGSTTPHEVPAATGLLHRPRRRHGRRPRPDGHRAARRAPTPSPSTTPGGSARSVTAYVDEAAVLPPSTAIPSIVRLPEVEQRPRGPRRRRRTVLRRWRQASGLRAQIGRRRRRHRHPRPARGRPARPGRRHHRLRQERAAAVADLLARAEQPAGAGSPSCSSTTRAARRSASAPTCPHTVGYITDLTPALVPARSPRWAPRSPPARSCSAEYGVKDLVQLEREHPEAAPPEPADLRRRVRGADQPRCPSSSTAWSTSPSAAARSACTCCSPPSARRAWSPDRSGPTPTCASRCGSPPPTTRATSSTPPRPPASRRRTPGRAWIRRTGHGTAELVQSAWTGARAAARSAPRTPVRGAAVRRRRRPAEPSAVPARTSGWTRAPTWSAACARIQEAFVRQRGRAAARGPGCRRCPSSCSSTPTRSMADAAERAHRPGPARPARRARRAGAARAACSTCAASGTCSCTARRVPARPSCCAPPPSRASLGDAAGAAGVRALRVRHRLRRRRAGRDRRAARPSPPSSARPSRAGCCGCCGCCGAPPANAPPRWPRRGCSDLDDLARHGHPPAPRLRPRRQPAGARRGARGRRAVTPRAPRPLPAGAAERPPGRRPRHRHRARPASACRPRSAVDLRRPGRSCG